MKALPSLATVALCLVFGGVAVAAGNADDLIKSRQDAMKGNAEALGNLVTIMRGVQPYDPATVTASLDTLSAILAAEAQGGLWDPSTQQGSAVQTRALPAIWQNPQGFADAQKMLQDAVTTVGASTDLASFKAAFPKLGAACKNCHTQFRSGEGG